MARDLVYARSAGFEPALPASRDDSRGVVVTGECSLPSALLAKLETLRIAGNEKARR